jgi:succinyl-CoA synthetase beta subunit
VLLYEHEGKRRFERHGIPIPAGALWPVDPTALSYPVMAKAQVLAGGRGRRGGVIEAGDESALVSAVEKLTRGSDVLPPADLVLVEQKLQVRRELYISLVLDRQGPQLLVSPEGGVDIEAMGDSVERIPLEIQTGPKAPIDRACTTLGEHGRELRRLLERAWRLFREEDCLLVEINPLAVTADGRLVAADARVVVDDAARPRHPDWPPAREGTDFELRCAELGATAVELDGDIAIITSGAGLGMATLDTVVELGGSARCVIDLGGAVFRGRSVLERVLVAAAELRPRAVLFNAFLQVADCGEIASAVAAALASGWPTADFPVVLRLRGRGFEEALTALDPTDVILIEDLRTACERAVDAAAA